jgi:hypothetical protein
MSQKNVRAEKDTHCRDDLGHSLTPWLEMPGWAAQLNALSQRKPDRINLTAAWPDQPAGYLGRIR